MNGMTNLHLGRRHSALDVTNLLLQRLHVGADIDHHRNGLSVQSPSSIAGVVRQRDGERHRTGMRGDELRFGEQSYTQRPRSFLLDAPPMEGIGMPGMGIGGIMDMGGMFGIGGIIGMPAMG